MKISDTIGSLLKSRRHNRILSITPEQTVFEALQMMAGYDVGALLVMSNDELVGILSERDYARKGVLMGHLSRETKVREIMTSPVLSISSEHTVDECMAMMTEHRFRHLPVLDGLRSRGCGLHRRLGEMGHFRPGAGHSGPGGLHHGRLSRLAALGCPHGDFRSYFVAIRGRSAPVFRGDQLLVEIVGISGP